MSQMHPLAVVNAGSITSLVRITLCHHSISVYRAKVGTSEDTAALGPEARGVAAESSVMQLMSAVCDVPSVKNQTPIEDARGK